MALAKPLLVYFSKALNAHFDRSSDAGPRRELLVKGHDVMAYLQAHGGCADGGEARELAAVLLDGGVLVASSGTPPPMDAAPPTDASAAFDPDASYTLSRNPAVRKPSVTGVAALTRAMSRSMSHTQSLSLSHSVLAGALGRSSGGASMSSERESMSEVLSSLAALYTPSLTAGASFATHSSSIDATGTHGRALPAARQPAASPIRVPGAPAGRTALASAVPPPPAPTSSMGAAISVDIPYAETRMDDKSGSAFAAYAVRVSLPHSSGVAPWIVFRRYRQFAELHKVLSRRLMAASSFGSARGGTSTADAEHREPASGSSAVVAAAPASTPAALPSLESRSDVAPRAVASGGESMPSDAAAAALALLPEFPSNSWSGMLSGGLGSDVVHARRKKLEAYLRELVRQPAVWQTGDELIIFLDNAEKTLAATVNNLRLLATQRMLTYVSVSNAKRAKAMDKKLSATHAAVEALSKKIQRMESLLTAAHNSSPATAAAAAAIAVSRADLPPVPEVTVPTLHSGSATSDDARSISGDRTHVIADYFDASAAAAATGRGPPASTLYSPLHSTRATSAPMTDRFGASAMAYVRDFAAPRGGAAAQHARASGDGDARSNSTSDATGGAAPVTQWPEVLLELSSEDVAALFVWLFGARDSGVCNPVRPLDASGELLAPTTEVMTPERLDWYQQRDRAGLPLAEEAALSSSAAPSSLEDRMGAPAALAVMQPPPMAAASAIRYGGGKSSKSRKAVPAPVLTPDPLIALRARAGMTRKFCSESGIEVETHIEFVPMYPAEDARSKLSGDAHGSAHDRSVSMADGFQLDATDRESPVAVDPRLQGLAAVVDSIVECLVPTVEAVQRRLGALRFLQAICRRRLGVEAFVTGSVATRTFLPSSDVDITLIMSAGQASDWFIRLNESLCIASARGASSVLSAAATPAQTIAGQKMAASMASATGSLSVQPQFQMVPTGYGGVTAAKPSAHATASGTHMLMFNVRNVSFINADVKLVRAVLDNLSADVSANQGGALGASALVEAMDRWVGKQHLFKRSLILIKAWLEMETPSIVGMAVLGSGKGGLSSYALAVLLMAVFNSSDYVIRHPLHALWLFFEEYASFPWGSHMVTINGPRHLYLDASRLDASYRRPCAPRFLSIDRLRPLRYFVASCVPPEMLATPAPEVRNVNVLDPLGHWNNIARSVSRKGVAALTSALQLGRARMRHVLQTLRTQDLGTSPPADSPASANRLFTFLFVRTVAWYCRGDRWREDMLTHPLESGGASERASRIAAQRLPVLGLTTHAAGGGVTTPGTAADALAGDAVALNHSLAYAAMLLSNAVTAPALAALTMQLLASHGPLPVGEVGKLLAEATGNPSLSAIIKEMYGGLKRFLENHPHVFRVGSDHPFNPLVHVVDLESTGATGAF